MENKASTSSIKLTAEDKNTIAWVFAVSDIIHFTSVIFLLCLPLWGVITLYRYLYEIGLSHYVWIGLMSMFFSLMLGFLLVSYKNQIYEELFDGTSWKENTGNIPSSFGYIKVNAEYENGDIVWNKSISDLNWDINITNPIKSYMLKK